MANFVRSLKIQDPVNGVLDGRGVINSGVTNLASLGNLNAPRFSYLASVTYSLDPVSVSLIMTGISAGVFYNGLTVCDTGCPTGNGVTTATSNANHIDSYKNFSLSANYMLGKWARSTVWLTICSTRILR